MNSTEFLDIGRHCSDASCRQLDFLPFSCPSCNLPFCQEHWRPEAGHKCASYDPALADNRIPSCPLCSMPISFPPGTDPNGPMDHHLSSECPVLHPHLAPGPRNKKSPNECYAKRCRTKMIVPIRCDACRETFCPAHRFPNDHACGGTAGAANPTSGATDASGSAHAGSGVKRVFYGLLSKKDAVSSPSALGTARAPTGTAPPRTAPGPSRAGLAALRRAQQARSAGPIPVATTEIAKDSSRSTASPLLNPSASNGEASHARIARTAPPAPAAASVKSSTTSHSGPKKALAATGLRGAQNKRAAQEQESAREALEARAKKGLLTEDEKVRFATMQAMAAKEGAGKANGEDSCVLC